MREPALLLWSQVLAVYALANYLTRDALHGESETTDASVARSMLRKWHVWVVARAAMAGAVVFYMSSHAPLSALVTLASIVLPLTRRRIAARRAAELEIGAAICVSVALGYLIVSADTALRRSVFALPFANSRISATSLVVALVLFTAHGGTYIVRGILNKAGTVPKVRDSTEAAVDVKEFNRGRLIGTLERILLFAVVLAGSYEALGFVVAAKGLVRSREFETDRDLTEYFLIGSLSSVLIALATGALARFVVQTYW